MNKKDLEIMIAFRQEGSISKAAKQVGISRSNASRALKKVQEEFDTALFISTSEGVVPTYAGEVYLQAAQEILDTYNNMITRSKLDSNR